MYKSFILPHLDFSDTLWDNCANYLAEDLESIQLDALRTITGTVRGTSHDMLYEESGFIPLKTRRFRHRLILFFKIIRGQTPQYLQDYLPPLVSEINPRHVRNPLERHIPFSRTELYSNSFFPQTTREWNRLPDNIKLLDSISSFKRHLSRSDTIVPPHFYVGNRNTQMIHCKMRLEMSDLNHHLFRRHLINDPSCDCSTCPETSTHFLFDCPLHQHIRSTTIFQLSNYLSRHIDTYLLLNGDSTLPVSANTLIFETVQEFIEKSGRFDI